MLDKERIAKVLNAYRDEIRAKSPKSFSIFWMHASPGNSYGTTKRRRVNSCPSKVG
jgi:hypothetical protein